MYNTIDITTFKSWLKPGVKIIITSHKSPDGDSIGSSLALFHYLKTLNINSTICHPDKMPDFLNWLPESENILTLEENKDLVIKNMAEADIIFSLDYNHPSRIGEMQNLLIDSSAKKIMIDHHQDPIEDLFDLSFSYPTISSTCELIYEFIVANSNENNINEHIGTPMYCGIMTDTGSFRFPSTTARTHDIISRIIKSGVKNHSIHEAVFDSESINKLQLNGYALSNKLQILDDLKIGIISLTKEELLKYNAIKGDTEGLVNRVLAIKGIKMAVFLKEDAGIIKMSFRSKGDVYVNILAKENFNGGGHVYAAGGMYKGQMDDAIEKLVTLLPNYVK